MQFLEYGDPGAPTLVLLHGASLLDTFAHQYNFSARYHLVVPHLPGAGSAVREPYEPEALVDGLHAFISSLGCNKVALMGHSVGAELAVALVCRDASLYSCAVFLSPWLFESESAARQYGAALKSMYGLLKNESLLRLQAKYWGLDAEQAARLSADARQIPLDTYLAFYQKRIRLDALSAYAGIELPMLAVCGARETADTRRSNQALGARNPRCKAVRLPRAGHDLVLRNADRLNPLLLAFLNEHCN